MKIFHSPTLAIALVFAGVVSPLAAQVEDQDLGTFDAEQFSVETTTDIEGDRPIANVSILSPTMNAVLDKNSATVVLEAPIGSSIDLQVNGVSVDSDQIGQLETNAVTGMMRQIWYGVIFKEGDNTLTAIATLNGQTTSTAIQLQSPGTVAALRLTTIEKRVPADGRSTVTVQGFLLDEKGNPSNRGGRITLVPSAGKFIGVDAGPDAAGFQVDARDGQFTATLQSSIDSGTTQIRANLFELEAFTQVQFETALRPSLMTGVIDLRIGADNTDYFGSFRDFLDPDAAGDTNVNLNGAAFATGPIGDWLLTAAVNYDRPLNETCETCTNRLFRADQQSEKPYPTYGDESSVNNVTPSQDQLYVRLEHSPGIIGADPDYLMWGDYSTGQEFATPAQEFSALSRQLHGAKVNYNFGDFQVSGLFSQGGESYQRDTILPDGTSGFYFLTQRLVVPGSEEIYFELEQLERPGTVLQRDRLQRGTDYDIDYDRGSIVFIDPVLRTEIGDEGELLVRRIVTTYQYESTEDNKLYAGRLQYHFDREQSTKSWFGATYFQEDKGDRDLEVYGLDTQFFLGENYKFLGEYAHSNNDSSVLGNVDGSAYKAEFIGKFSSSITGRAYYRHADTEFANQSTVSFVPGQTRYGAELDTKISKDTTFRLRYDHEKNEGVNIRPIISLGDLLAAGDEGIPASLVDGSLTTVSAGLSQKLGKSNVSVDWIYRDRQDEINLANNTSSSQLRTRFTTPLRDNLRLSLTNETTLSANTDAIYNDRTQASLDWRMLPGVNLALNQNWYTRGSLAGQSTTSVNLGGEYRLWKNTVFTGRYSVENFSTGIEDYAGFGLKHRWTVIPGFHLDAAYERVIGGLFLGADGAVGQGVSRTAQTRSGDSLSVRLGYTDNPNFKAQAQYEYRNTNDSRTSNVSGSLLGKLSPSLTALFNFDRRFAAGAANRGLPASSNVRLGLAYRNPHSDRLNALLRYEYRRNPETTPESLIVGSGIGTVEHLLVGEAIYSPNWQWEFYTKMGFRSSTVDLADTFSATSTIGLAQFRARYQLNRHIDLTGGIRWIGQPTAGFSEMGLIGEIGYQATPGLRVSLGYSSGEVNSDRDFDGSRSDGGFYVGAMLKLDSLFGGFGFQQPISQSEVQRQLVVENPEAEAGTLQAALPQNQPLRLDVSQTIDFTSTSAALSTEGRVVLDSLVTVMQQYGELTLDIQGVLPPLAQLTPNNLDAKRLQAARQYLLSRGVTGDRIVIRSMGQAAEPEIAAKLSPPVTFALNAPAETFQLLSSQLTGDGLIGSLLGEELPELASLPPLDLTGDRPTRVTNNGATPMAWRQQPVLETADQASIPVRLPLLSFVPEDELTVAPVILDLDLPETSQQANNYFDTAFSFSAAPEWLLGFAPIQETLVEEALAIALRPNPEFADQLITLRPVNDADFLITNGNLAEAQLLTSLNVDFAEIETSASTLPVSPDVSFVTARDANSEPLTDLALNTTEENTLILSQTVSPDTPPLALNSSVTSLRQSQRLEAALTYLLSDDIDALDAILLQATGNRAPVYRGELIDLDAVMGLGAAQEGTL
ncbi:MAG: hypothetical protein WBB82_18170 [Limnothrix sp.]